MRERPSLSEQTVDNITFSSAEIRWAEKHIKRLEKDIKHWPWLRWVMLVFSIMLLGGTVYALKIYIPKLMEIWDSFSYVGREFVPERLEILVDGKISAVRLEMFLMLRLLFYAIMGLALFIYSLTNWNRHITSSLLAKVIRTQMLGNQADRVSEKR